MFRKSRVVVIVAGAALAAGAAGVIASQASQPRGRGHGSPLALRQRPAADAQHEGLGERRRGASQYRCPAARIESGAWPDTSGDRRH